MIARINMSGFMKVQEDATEQSFELVCSHACVFFSFNDTYSEELKLLPQLYDFAREICRKLSEVS